MKIDYLVKNANQIGSFFEGEADLEVAARDVAGHIKRFWTPLMCSQIVSHVEEHDGEGLSPLVIAAIRSNRDSLCGGLVPIREDARWVGPSGASDAG